MFEPRAGPYLQPMELPAQPLTLASRPPLSPAGLLARHCLAIATLIAGLATLLFILFSMADVGGLRPVWDVIHWTLSPITALGIVIIGARRAAGLDRRIRTGLIGVVVLWLASQVAWLVQSSLGPMPIPSLGDLLILATPLPVGAVVLAYARTQLSGPRLHVLYLDCIAVCIAWGAVLIAIHPAAPGAQPWTDQGVLALGYSLAFVGSGSVAGVAAIALRAEVAPRGAFLVSNGIVALGLLFTWWMTGVGAGELSTQVPGYLMSLALIATAVGMATWRAAPETRPAHLRLLGISQDVIPLASLVAAAAALLIPDVPEVPEEVILKILAVATTTVLVARQTILLRERHATLLELRDVHAQAELALQSNRDLNDLLRERIVQLEGMQGQLVHASRQAAVGQLASALAHEVNNPLTGVLGYADLLLSDLPPDGHGREELETIRSEALRARKIIRSVVDFARPRAPEQAPADINEVARVTVDLIRYHVERGGIDIREAYVDLPVMTVDRAAIGQLLLNLLNNAVQSMPGGGTLRIASRVDGDHVAISIADDGGGMDEVTLGRVFEPFFTTRNLDAGHGLGLPVAIGIAEAHGGTIDIVSQPEHGTIAELRLPMSLATAASSTGTTD